MQDEIVSKTRKKREMHELQALGVALVELPETQLKSMALADDLLEAVLEAKRITSHEARRRQMQYIGRLMRDIDPAAIRKCELSDVVKNYPIWRDFDAHVPPSIPVFSGIRFVGEIFQGQCL